MGREDMWFSTEKECRLCGRTWPILVNASDGEEICPCQTGIPTALFTRANHITRAHHIKNNKKPYDPDRYWTNWICTRCRYKAIRHISNIPSRCPVCNNKKFEKEVRNKKQEEVNEIEIR